MEAPGRRSWPNHEGSTCCKIRLEAGSLHHHRDKPPRRRAKSVPKFEAPKKGVVIRTQTHAPSYVATPSGCVESERKTQEKREHNIPEENLGKTIPQSSRKPHQFTIPSLSLRSPQAHTVPLFSSTRGTISTLRTHYYVINSLCPRSFTSGDQGLFSRVSITLEQNGSIFSPLEILSPSNFSFTQCFFSEVGLPGFWNFVKAPLVRKNLASRREIP